jgi:hypothetical protein
MNVDYVITNVSIVLTELTTVLLVSHQELMLHLVAAQKDSSITETLVLDVPTIVLPVLIETVVFPALETELEPLVNVHMDSMIPVKPIVNNVTQDVLPVTEIMSVPNVSIHPKELFHLVNVLKVGWMLKTVSTVIKLHIQKDLIT